MPFAGLVSFACSLARVDIPEKTGKSMDCQHVSYALELEEVWERYGQGCTVSTHAYPDL